DDQGENSPIHLLMPWHTSPCLLPRNEAIGQFWDLTNVLFWIHPNHGIATWFLYREHFFPYRQIGWRYHQKPQEYSLSLHIQHRMAGPYIGHPTTFDRDKFSYARNLLRWYVDASLTVRTIGGML